jgi:putrescine transport system substrate-binding protein
VRRRSAIRRALIAASIGFALPLIAASDDVVNIFSWTNYIDAKAIPSFEEKTGIKVVYDLMDSNDVLEGKLLAGKSGTTSCCRRRVSSACR